MLAFRRSSLHLSLRRFRQNGARSGHAREIPRADRLPPEIGQRHFFRFHGQRLTEKTQGARQQGRALRRVDGGGVKVGDALLPRTNDEKSELSEGAQVLAFARPYEIEIVPEGQAAGEGVAATVSRVLSFGMSTRVELEGQGRHFEVELSRERAEALGLTVGQAVRLAPSNLRVFEYEEGAGI